MKMYDGITIAKFIVNTCNDLNIQVTNQRLQKILYFTQAFSIEQRGRNLFKDTFTCWKYGPVVQSIYSYFKCYGGMNIEYEKTWVANSEGKLIEKQIDSSDIALEDKDLITKVIHMTKRYNDIELMNVSMNQSPWVENYQPNTSKEIPMKDMFNFFMSC